MVRRGTNVVQMSRVRGTAGRRRRTAADGRTTEYTIAKSANHTYSGPGVASLTSKRPIEWSISFLFTFVLFRSWDSARHCGLPPARSLVTPPLPSTNDATSRAQVTR